MIINLTYIFFILVGFYFGVIAYIATRKREIFIMLGIFVLSFFLEMDWMSSGGYELDVNDFLWTSRDIIWTLTVIYLFWFMRINYPYIAKFKSRLKKKIGKKTKK